MTEETPKKPNKWITLAIVAGLFAVFVPVAFKFGQSMARDGMDKALAEKAAADADASSNLPEAQN